MPDYEQIAAKVSIGPESTVVPPDQVQQLLSKDREFLPLDHPKYQGIAAAKNYQQKENRLQRVHYSHEAIIDRMITDPTLTQRQLASEFQVSENWLSTVVGSDAFQAALAKRRDDLLDPLVVASIEERFKGAVHLSLSVITEKLETSRNTDLALKTLDISAKVLGFGARAGGNGQTNQFIIQLPPKSDSSETWNATHNPMKQLPSSED
jgi:hypothetical protein